MQTVIIVIHLLIVIALVGVVLIQRSEGGGLGIGGGSGFMTARGAKNTLTRVTAVLAACFFVTSLILTVMQFVPSNNGAGILKQVSAQSKPDSLEDSLGGGKAKADSPTQSSGVQSSGAQKSGSQTPAGNQNPAGNKAKADIPDTSGDDAHG